jgi:hypothetical protein
MFTVGEVKGVDELGVRVACRGARSRGDRRSEIEVDHGRHKDPPTNPGEVSSCGYRRHPHGNPHVRYRGMGKTLENTLKAGINTKLPTCDAEGVFHDNEGTLDVKGVKISIAADIW